jgi:transposase
VDEALAALSPEFEKLYARFGRPSIPPERLLRALLLQAFYSVRSEKQLVEQLDYNLLFRWFVGLSLDDQVWDETVFTKNRERLIEGDIARKFMAAVLSQGSVKALLSDDHFAVDGTLIEAWASMKSFRPKDGGGEPPAAGRNGERDFHGEKRSNQTHASTTDPDARLYRKGPGQPAKLAYLGHVLMENRHALVVDTRLTLATGTAEREAALEMVADRPGRHRITLCRQGLRCGRVCRRSARAQRDAACGAEHHQSAIGNRRSDNPPSRLCGQWAGAQAHRGGVWLDQDRRRLPQDPSPRPCPRRLDVYADCHCLQPRPAAQASGGRGVAMPGICPDPAKTGKIDAILCLSHEFLQL